MFVEIWTIEDLMINTDLECLLFEISIPDRHLGSTPNFPPEPFNAWALECDWQNCRWKKELYLLDAVNCNLLSEANVHVYLFVSCILNIYGLYELITEPRGAYVGECRFVFLPKWHFGKMFLTSRVLLLCKSQHFTGTLLVIMIAKNLYPSCWLRFAPPTWQLASISAVSFAFFKFCLRSEC